MPDQINPLSIHLVAVAATGMCLAGPVQGQGKNTVIHLQDGQVVGVTMEQRPIPDSVFNSFEETDSDGDGRVSRTEARNAGILAFADADADRNGWLDAAEYQTAGHASSR